MKPYLSSSSLALCALLLGSCTLSEVSNKTKGAFSDSASYVRESGEKAYESGRRALGLSENNAKPAKPMSISKRKFGVLPDGRQVSLYLMTNANGMQVSLLDYGGTVKEIRVPDRNGKFANVSLGFSTLEDYLEKSPYFGCITGRYANRIAKGRFSLNGENYQLAVNNGPNHLHGGEKGFDKRMWKARIADRGTALVFTRKSPDGEEGYPGNLDCRVTYTLTNENELRVEYEAKTDKPTVVNLTNHTYFNLAGEGNGDVLNHQLTLPGDRFVATDETNVPIAISKVAGTPLDFTKAREVGERIDANHTQIVHGKGYDHTWLVPPSGEELSLAARLRDPVSGRVLEILTDQPGVQVYTGNYLDGTLIGQGGKPYAFRSGICLETQVFPDSPNHQGEEGWRNCALLPGETYSHVTVHRFTVE